MGMEILHVISQIDVGCTKVYIQRCINIEK